MRQGVCHLIYSMAVAKVPLSQKERHFYFKTMLENFKHPNIEIQEEATKAYKAFCRTYLDQNPEDIQTSDKQILLDIKGMFRPSSVDENVALTRGYNMSFGVLSPKLYTMLTPEIFDTLIKNAVQQGKESDDADTRKQAVKSLIQSVETVGVSAFKHDY